jgi:hypothetical protein
MKATIDERGCLHVEPESALESFALGQWWKGFEAAGELRSSTLRVGQSSKPPERPANCTYRLREEGKPYPRTCAECGLGPCKGQGPNKHSAP